MKKKLTKPVIAVLLGAMTFSSCIGSFGLTNSVLDWNKRATDNKFVNEIIFVLISPAYAVCSFADLLVLNSIEFWTGNKVIGQVGTTKDVMGKDGRMYANKSWSYSKDGDIRELFSFNEDGSIQACLPNGEKINVPADANGLYQVRMAMNDGLFYAFNK